MVHRLALGGRTREQLVSYGLAAVQAGLAKPGRANSLVRKWAGSAVCD